MTALSAVMWIPGRAKAWEFKLTLTQNQEPFRSENCMKISFQLL